MDSFNKAISNIAEAQLNSLDDSDPYASVWADAVDHAVSSSNKFVSWGGRGKGGRGLSRRTWQPYDIVVPNVYLEYVPEYQTSDCNNSSHQKNATQCRTLLVDTTIKLLSGGKIYGLVGRNGIGKSTLLKRMQAGKISGWPIHLSCLYISQDTSLHFSEWREKVIDSAMGKEKTMNGTSTFPSPIQLILHHYQSIREREELSTRQQIESLEQQIQNLDIENNPDDAERLQSFCEQISELEGEWEDFEDGKIVEDSKMEKAKEALLYLAVPERLHHVSMDTLSPGLIQKVLLASAYFYRPQLLLLDEPTKDMDVVGLVQLRKMIYEFSEEDSKTTIVLVSHDIDLMNDVVTDIIHFHDQKLEYYPNCNYCGFLKLKYERDISSLRQAHILDVKRTKMIESIDKMKERSLSKDATSDGAKKLQKGISNKQKKLDKAGIERDPKGHRWNSQTMGTGIRPGSINSADTSSRKKISYGQLIKITGSNVARLIDKAVQFKYVMHNFAFLSTFYCKKHDILTCHVLNSFHSCTSNWGGDLIKLTDVGHGYSSLDTEGNIKAHHLLFEGVDLNIAEKSKTFIIGANSSGKSTLLKILAGVLSPSQGKVHHANQLQIGYFDQKMTDDLLKLDGELVQTGMPFSTALTVLSEEFPEKTEQELRGELSSFGIGPFQATNRLAFLSGGERCRVCLARIMLRNPEILLLDEITNHLDVESVEALIYGLKQWNGTLVLVSHDANLIREIGGTCYIVLEQQRRVLRMLGGIDAYVQALQISH